MSEIVAIVLIVLLVPVGLFIMAVVALSRTTKLRTQQEKFEKAVSEKLDAIEKRLLETDRQSDTPAKTVAEKKPDDSVSEAIADQEDGPTETVEGEGTTDSSEADATGADEITEPVDEELAAAAMEENASGPWGGAYAREESSEEEEPKPQAKQESDFEKAVGGRWSVILGGLALALGVIFLVRHSIEAGLLGPGTRIVLGALFSAALFGAGEWLRRSDRDFDLPVYAKADVPGILTGAGAIGAFATVYAAHALYGFVGPGFAFIALTMIGILTMLLSAIHGPKLAAVGVLGAYAAPLLVSSSDPNSVALALHVLVVTAVVMAIAHIRNWSWLAVAGIVASCVWTALASAFTDPAAGVAGAMLVIGLTAIFAVLFVLRSDEEIADAPFDRIAGLAFGAIVIGFLAQLTNDTLPQTATALITSLIIAAACVCRPAVAPISFAAGAIALFAIMASNLPFKIIDGLTQTSDITNNLVPRDTGSFIRNVFLLAVPPALLNLWGANRFAIPARRAAGFLATTTAGIAFFGLVIAYLRIAPFETRPLFGLFGIIIAGLLAIATEYFIRKRPDDDTAPAPAALAVGAVAAASFALAVSLDKGWMPLAFGLTALGISAIFLKRPVAALPWLAMIAGAICGFTLFVNMPLELPEVSSTLIFNGLILLIAVPAIALLASGELLRRSGFKVPTITETALTAGGLALAALFVGLEVTHIVNGGDMQSSRQSLAEMSGHVLAALGFAAGLQRIAGRTETRIYDIASQVAGIAGVVMGAAGLLLFFNPYFDEESVGTGLIFNLLLPGYLLTGLAAVAVALLSRPVRPRWYTLMYAAFAGLLLFTYFSLMLRKTFQGQFVDISRYTSDLEFWLYSPLWLVMGALLLAIGLRLKSLPIRIASGVLIALTVVKVFLLDMASLEGFLRALSFIGLGISLIVIGRFYQRILTRQALESRQATSEES